MRCFFLELNCPLEVGYELAAQGNHAMAFIVAGQGTAMKVAFVTPHNCLRLKPWVSFSGFSYLMKLMKRKTERTSWVPKPCHDSRHRRLVSDVCSVIHGTWFPGICVQNALDGYASWRPDLRHEGREMKHEVKRTKTTLRDLAANISYVFGSHVSLGRLSP